MAELKARTDKARFGEVRDITAVDYVQEVNKAGEGIMVVLHLYKQVTTLHYPTCLISPSTKWYSDLVRLQSDVLAHLSPILLSTGISYWLGPVLFQQLEV
jgi:hypothetical protein